MKSNLRKLNSRVCYRCNKRFLESREQCPYCKAFQPIKNLPPKDGASTLWGMKRLSEGGNAVIPRIRTNGPWDECFGGEKHPGIPEIATILLGGSPGAGKSTIILQLADGVIAAKGGLAMTIAAEEEHDQIRERGLRLGLKHLHNMVTVDLSSFAYDLEQVIHETKPSIIFVDSVTGLFGNDYDAAVNFAKNLKRIATKLRSPVILIDQIVKDGDLHGFMSLQHEVDATAKFEVDHKLDLLNPFNPKEPARVLNFLKNRFASLNYCILQMTEHGLCEGYEDVDENE